MRKNFSFGSIFPQAIKLLDKRGTFAFLLLTGLVIRLLYAICLDGAWFSGDPLSYYEDAVKLANSEAYLPYWPPGLPAWLALFMKVFGISKTVCSFSMLLMYLAFSFLLYHTSRKFFSRPLSNLLQLVFMLWPACIHYSIVPSTQLPVALLMTVLIFSFVSFKQQAYWRYLVLAGFALGAMVLFRPSSLFLACLTPFLFFAVNKRIHSLLLPLVTMILLSGSWVLYTHQMNDKWILINTSNSRNFFLGNNPYTPLYKSWWLGSHEAPLQDPEGGYQALIEKVYAFPEEERGPVYKSLAFQHIQGKTPFVCVQKPEPNPMLFCL